MDYHLEFAYREFEEGHFQSCEYWRAPACVLRGTFLFPVYERFAQKFTEHVGEENTVFYLTTPLNSSPSSGSIILTNSHFECTGYDDLLELVAFIEYARGILNNYSLVNIDRIDGIREEIILVFDSPRQEVVDLFEGSYQHFTARGTD